MVDVSTFHGQTLGGYEMRFPTGGVSNTIESVHYDRRFTPKAVNVILAKNGNEDYCGGTRPGLKPFTTQPTTSNSGKWLWPNGDVISWSNGDVMIFGEVGSTITLPGGARMIDQHETFNVAASKGSIPTGFTSAAFYRDRVVVAKDAMWYASRIGTRDDFDYGGDMDDISRAVAGSVSLAGRSGENITALAAIKDDALVIATNRSIWLVAGDVTQSEKNISDNIGIVSRHAWCFDGRRMWFLGPNGLYYYAFGNAPSLMTEHLEGSLTGFKSAVLVYDPERIGIHIFGVKRDDSISDWYYDIGNKAAWPVLYPNEKRPVGGGCFFTEGRDRVAFLCADGTYRYWDESQTTDDGTDIKSALVMGPATHTTGNTENGFLAEMVFEAKKYTANTVMNVSLVCGKTYRSSVEDAETTVGEIISGASSLTKERARYAVCDGWNAVVRPRVRCNAFAPVVWSASGRWAISKITAAIRGCGRIRS